MADFGKYSDTIDSRDVIERIAELFQDLADLADGSADRDTGRDPDEAELREDLRVLLALQDEAQGYSEDWRHGATLIRDSYFERYAEELADDIGAVKDTAAWPLTCIDWKQAARELQQDYTSVEYDGVTYWIR